MAIRKLKVLEKKLDKALKKQTQQGLADIFDELRCKAVASKIRQGRNVTGNAEFGVKMCVHDRIGPRYDPIKKKFTPMSKSAKSIESKFVKLTNDMLKTGGFKPMSPQLISKFRKGDREFEREVKRRR